MATFEESVDKAIEVAVERAVAKAVSQAHPIGSIYLTLTDSNPSSLFGGTWEKVGSGKCLWLADSSHGAGTTISAGLPTLPEIDILYRRDCTSSGVEVDKYGHDGQSISGDTPANTSGTDEYMQSSLALAYTATPYGARYVSNSIYGSSDTVQPPAYVVIAWKRTA